jgi:sterol desaturase/sphingolipid hydroxylase (fatty acid hydroxylase superfamily)
VPVSAKSRRPRSHAMLEDEFWSRNPQRPDCVVGARADRIFGAMGYERGAGIFNWVAAPWWLALLATLLIRSLAQYAFHRHSHRSLILWRVHRVHHCDVHLDASSALRFHPLEMIANIAFAVPIIMFWGLAPAVLAVYECVEIIVGMMTHTNLRIPKAMEQIARPLLVTPGLHRRHHSAD